MKKAILALLALPLLVPMAMAEDVAGFWNTESDGDNIELFEDGTALLRDEDGEVSSSGSYTMEGSNVNIVAGDETIEGVVTGDSLILSDSGIIYEREQEIRYWISTRDNSALELADGHVWSYDENAELIAEGSYTLSGGDIHIELNGNVMAGTIDGDTMTLDGVEYSLL